MKFSDNLAFLHESPTTYSCDWEKMSIQDIKKAHDEASIARYLPIVLHSYLECDSNLDPRFAKLFAMAQTCVKYLHNCLLQVSQNEYCSREKIPVKTQSSSQYPVYQCLYCAKAFVSSQFLQNHVRRRHERVSKLYASNHELPATSQMYQNLVPSPGLQTKISVAKCSSCSSVLPSDMKTSDTPQSVHQERLPPHSSDQENLPHLIEARLLEETKRIIEEHLKKANVTKSEPPSHCLPLESCATPHDAAPAPRENEGQIQVPLKRTSHQECGSDNEPLRTKTPSIAYGRTVDFSGKQPEPVLMQSERFGTGFPDNALSSLIVSEDDQRSPNQTCTASERTTKKKKEPSSKVHKIVEMDASPVPQNKTATTKSQGRKRVRFYISQTLENRLNAANVSSKSLRISSIEMSDVLTGLRKAREQAWKGKPHVLHLRDNIAEKLHKRAMASLAQSSLVERETENRSVRCVKRLFNEKKTEKSRVRCDTVRGVRSPANVENLTYVMRKGTEANDTCGHTSWNSEVEYEALRTPISLSRNGEI